ncbi:MAG: tetratricopeptide repeat protein [Prevotella sp.]
MKNLISTIMLLCCVFVAQAQTDRKYIRDGNRLYHGRDFAKAETMYRKAIADNPYNAQAIYNLGCALMMQNKDSAAVEQFQNVAKIEKNKQRLYKSYHNIGVICQNHKMYAEAIKAYEQALRNNPGDNETRYNLVLCKKLNKNKNDKKQDNKNDKDNKNNNKNQNKDKNKDKNDQKSKENQQQMSKDNAEQLLNAAIQNERMTQQRMKQAMRKPSSSKRLQKNW